MNEEIFTLRSSIQPKLLQFTLWRGTCLACAGALLLNISAIFFPSNILKYWGFPIFLLSIFFVALGLIPYLRLRKLENSPNTLIINNGEYLFFSTSEKPLFSIPLTAIEECIFIKKKHLYGIKIRLNNPLKKRIITYSPFDFNPYIRVSQKNNECNLFLPYFTKRSFDALKRELSELSEVL